MTHGEAICFPIYIAFNAHVPRFPIMVPPSWLLILNFLKHLLNPPLSVGIILTLDFPFSVMWWSGYLAYAHKWGLSSFLFLHFSFIVTLEEKFFRAFFSSVDLFFLSYLILEGQIHYAYGMLWGGSSATSPFALWLVGKIAQKELEVKDVEFEEGCMKVVYLVVNHHQLSRSWVSPCQVQGGHRY